MTQAKYEWWRGADGDWYWHLKAPNGRIIASGEGYKTKAGALRGIASHRRHAATLKVVERPCPSPKRSG